MADDAGKSVEEASGEGNCCMFLELGPLLSGFLLGLERFSGDGSRSVGFASVFRLPMTVPKRFRPLIPPFLCSFGAADVSSRLTSHIFFRHTCGWLRHISSLG